MEESFLEELGFKLCLEEQIYLDGQRGAENREGREWGGGKGVRRALWARLKCGVYVFVVGGESGEASKVS